MFKQNRAAKKRKRCSKTIGEEYKHNSECMLAEMTNTSLNLNLFTKAAENIAAELKRSNELKAFVLKKQFVDEFQL